MAPRAFIGLAAVLLVSVVLLLPSSVPAEPSALRVAAPVQALESHPIYDRILAQGIGPAGLAHLMLTDADGNRVTDFGDLWVRASRAAGEPRAPVEVLVYFSRAPGAADALALERAGRGADALVLEDLSAVFLVVESARLQRLADVSGVSLVVWEPRAHLARAPVADPEHVNLVDADEAWAMGFTGTGRIIAVIDSGIDRNHPSFTEGGTRPYTDKILHWADKVANQPLPYDDNGHGSHVASIAAGKHPGRYTGIAPEASLYIFKAFDKAGTADLGRISASVNNIIAMTPHPDVVSFSAGAATPALGLFCLNGGSSDLFGFDKVATKPVNVGIPFVSAAGNTLYPGLATFETSPQFGINGYNAVSSPAADERIIAIGAASKWAVHAPFSCLGPGADTGSAEALQKPDVLTAGIAVEGAQANKGNYVRFDGTSMATPAAAGIVALLKEKDGTLTPKQVKSLLQQGSVPGSLGQFGINMDVTQLRRPDFSYGYGIGNAKNSLELVS